MKKRILFFSGCTIVVLAVIIHFFLYAPIQAKREYKTQIEEYFALQNNEQNAANVYAQRVSMMELVARPEDYYGKLVRVIGVGRLEFESDALYLSRDDWKFSTSNVFSIDLGPRALPYKEAKAYNGKYVIVEGFFEKSQDWMYRGAIRDISRYELWDIYRSNACQIAKQADNTYLYSVKDYYGNELKSETGLLTWPERQLVDTDILGVVIRNADGDIATGRTTYFELEKGYVSREYYAVVAAQKDLVAYVGKSDSGYAVIVQHIFYPDAYTYTVCELENFKLDAGSITETVQTGDTVKISYRTNTDTVQSIDFSLR